ncbi:MAG: beta-ketoacyl-[acyl-carrier-protein] synthase family protein [Planctomycetota bacterium]
MIAANQRRVVVTGMAIQTPLGGDLETFYANLLAGRSAIRQWRSLETEGVYSKIGGDLAGHVDGVARREALRERLPDAMHRRLRQLSKKAPFSTEISMLVAAEGWRDAGLTGQEDPTRSSVLVGGHNLNQNYLIGNYETFRGEPDYIDAAAALLMLDTDHAGSVSEVLGWKGSAFTLGGACASANLALRTGLDEIRHHDQDLVMVVGPVLEFSALDVQAMALMGAISIESFNDCPEAASRPWDKRREGFVPSHGAGVLVLEELGHALGRGARIYAEVLGCTATADGCHLPAPSPEGQTRTIERLLQRTGTRPEDVDFVCAHATSTPQGDLSEMRALRAAFGSHADRLKVNAPKSMLGHTCWSAPVVETVAALLQMQGGVLHPSINIDELDDEVALDVCAEGPVEHRADVLLKNSFGFGGINCCALYRRFEEGDAR